MLSRRAMGEVEEVEDGGRRERGVKSGCRHAIVELLPQEQHAELLLHEVEVGEDKVKGGRSCKVEGTLEVLAEPPWADCNFLSLEG